MDDAEDRDERDDAPPFSSSSKARVPPEPERRSRSRSKSKSRSESKSVTASFDLASVTRALGDAYGAGGTQSRMAFESLQTAYAGALAQLSESNKLNAQLTAQLAAFSSSNPTIALLQSQYAAAAEKDKLGEQEKWKTIREVTPKLLDAAGPHAGPLMAFLAKKFGIAAPVTPPAAGDKSPRAAVRRVLARLQDGSEKSECMAQMLQGFVSEVCGEDFSVVWEFLAGAVQDGGST